MDEPLTRCRSLISLLPGQVLRRREGDPDRALIWLGFSRVIWIAPQPGFKYLLYQDQPIGFSHRRSIMNQPLDAQKSVF